MLGMNRATELATSLLHGLSGLYSAFEHATSNDPSGAISIALVTGLCVLIIAGAAALAEVVRVKSRRYVRRHELEAKSPEPREEDRDA